MQILWALGGGCAASKDQTLEKLKNDLEAARVQELASKAAFLREQEMRNLMRAERQRWK
ncbi:MAG TPA: hypothetical protein VGZ22_21760 [Isosphaeraceae bacterium]|jgi:hypothetical protein|nr:hypothetical protein [Isosphaeraceae bacterium]